MNDDRQTNGFWSGFVLGIFVGAGGYYFLTNTEEGKKVKKQLQEKSKEAFGQLDDLIEEIEEKGEQFRQKAQKIQSQLATEEELSQIDKLRERGQAVSQKFFLRNGKPLN